MKNRFSLPLVIAFSIVIFLSAAVWTKQGQGASAVRQAWEYKTLGLEIFAGSVTLYEDGKQIGTGKGPLTRAQALGVEGWELVSVAATSAGGGQTSTSTVSYLYWFKRPK